MKAPAEFNLHGLAGIRLVDATAADTATVGRQLGLRPAPLEREPDLAIRFVDRLPNHQPTRLLGRDDAGFTNDAFLVLQGRYKSRARVQIPFQQIGSGCEIVCERGLDRVPLLTVIVNLIVLGNGALPLHAAAFRFNGTGVLVTGWSKGGKTETLLAFMAHGARYVGDQWVYLSADGQRVYGMSEPIRIWSWQLDSMPQYRRLIGRGDRARMRLLRLALDGMELATDHGARHKTRLARTINRLAPLVRKHLCVDIPPAQLFGPEACEEQGTQDRLFFVASHDAPEVTVRTIDPGEIARRMVYSHQQEQMPLLSYYWKFRFAFPHLSNNLIENSRELQEESLTRVLEDKASFEVLHPHHVALPELYEAIRPYCV